MALTPSTMLELGTKASDFSLPATAGPRHFEHIQEKKRWSLFSFAGAGRKMTHREDSPV